MSFEATAILLAWVAILLLALAVSGLIRQLRAINVRQRIVATATGNGSANTAITLQPALVGSEDSPSVLLFLTPGCKSCESRLQDLESIARSATGSVSFAAVFPDAANGSQSSEIKVLEHKKDLFAQLHIPVTPFGVVLSKDGVVSHARPVGSSETVHQLVEAARSET